MTKPGDFVKNTLGRQIGDHLAHRWRCLDIFREADDMHRHRTSLQGVSAIEIETGLPLVDQVLRVAVGEAHGVV